MTSGTLALRLLVTIRNPPGVNFTSAQCGRRCDALQLESHTATEDYGHHQRVYREQGWRSDLLARPAQCERGGGSHVPLPAGPGAGGGGQKHRCQVRRETWHPGYVSTVRPASFSCVLPSKLWARR